MKPIETRYADCRFRSRLEARWAVFFKTLGVKWEYEQQGYVIRGTPYLPDFYLPDLHMWAEVKGDLDLDTFKSLALAAEELPPIRPTKGTSHHDRLIVLGSIPGPAEQSQLPHFYEVSGITYWTLANFNTNRVPETDDMRVSVWREGWDQFTRDDIDKWWFGRPTLPSSTCKPWPLSDDVAAAYRAARSARFEHGECG